MPAFDKMKEDKKDCPCFLSIDGGGTKTEFVVFTADGTVLFREKAAASNPNDIGMHGCCNIVSAVIAACYEKYPNIQAVHCGIAGTSSKAVQSELHTFLQGMFPSLRFSFTSDTDNLLACDEKADIALICGTGSVAFVKTENGCIRLGGWGYLFDEKGSAYDIGKDGIRAALAELDGIGPQTKITPVLLQALRTDGLWNAVPLLYKEGRPKIAALSACVFEAAKENDTTAQRILDQNMRHLAMLLNTAKEKYGCRYVLAGGGLFAHQRDVLLPYIKKYTDLPLHFCRTEPVFGACRLCLKNAGVDESASFAKTFQESYEVLL